MMKCSHCSLLNNNYRYCEGCGRPLTREQKKKYEKLPENSTKFLDEAVAAVESIFFSESVGEAQLEISSSALNLHDIVKSSGIMIIDDKQWEKVKASECRKIFFNDVFLTIILSAVFAGSSMIVSGLTLLAFSKLWVLAHIFISFFLWVIFPFLTGSTFSALMLFRSGLFSDNKSVKGSLQSLVILFLFLQLYIFLPILLMEYLLTIKKMDYIPFILRVSGVDFLIRTGGDY